MKKISIFSVIIIFVDQIIKYLISHNIKLNSHICIFKKIFYIAHVRNDGAAWSIMSGDKWLLILIALIAIVIIYKTFIENKKIDKMDTLIYSLLLGGIIGNLVDRIIYGYVIDYVEFIIFKYRYPIFNLADICIVIAVIFIIIKSIREEVCKRKTKE